MSDDLDHLERLAALAWPMADARAHIAKTLQDFMARGMSEAEAVDKVDAVLTGLAYARATARHSFGPAPGGRAE